MIHQNSFQYALWQMPKIIKAYDEAMHSWEKEAEINGLKKTYNQLIKNKLVNDLSKNVPDAHLFDDFVHCLVGLRLLKSFGEKRYVAKEASNLKKRSFAILEKKGIYPNGKRLSQLYLIIYESLGNIFLSLKGVRWQWCSQWYFAMAKKRHSSAKIFTPNKFEVSPELKARFQGGIFEHFPKTTSDTWDQHFMQAQIKGSVSPLLAYLKSNSPTQRQCVICVLWAFCVKKKQYRHKKIIDLMSTLKRSPCFINVFIEGPLKLYDSSLDKAKRLENAGLVLSRIFEVNDAKLVLMILLAYVRGLGRLKSNDELLKIVLNLYRYYSLQFSEGKSDDALWGLVDMSTPLPSVNYKRIWQHSYLLVKLVGRFGLARIHYLFAEVKNKKRFSEVEKGKLLNIVNEYMSTLKGPIMKLGQTSSYLLGPDYFVQRPDFEKLQNKAQAMDFCRVEKVVCSELSIQNLGELFSFFDKEAHGVGSIGQVHLAVLKNGTKVAVKIKHEGIERDICADLMVLKVISPLLKLLAPHMDVKGAIEEIQHLLFQEADYRIEADNQTFFRNKYRGHKYISIPQVFHDLSTSNVLTSEWVDGPTFQEFLKTRPCDNSKKQMTTLVAKFIISSCLDGKANTDPHPGNFIVQKEKIFCIDFGSVKPLDAKRQRTWAKGIIAAFDPKATEHFDDFARNFFKISSFKLVVRKKLELIFFGPCIQKFSQERETEITYDEILSEVKKALIQALKVQNYIKFDVHYIYFLRVYGGLISLLANAKVAINLSNLVGELIDARS